jgi:hypothetical protein
MWNLQHPLAPSFTQFFLKIKPNALHGVSSVSFMSLLLFVAISSFLVGILVFWLFPHHFLSSLVFSKRVFVIDQV